MASKTLVFFNNKGGVGKTTTVYHLTWMLAENGYNVLAVDLDPQSNLSSMFLSDERMEEIILKDYHSEYTVLGGVSPISEGDPYQKVHLESISENIALIIGDLTLSSFEDKLSDAWNKCLGGDKFAFKVTSVFNTIFRDAAERFSADWLLIDVGPNLGAINRAVLISSDFVALPVASDMFSLQGIKNLGTTLQKWTNDWAKRKEEYPDKKGLSELPDGSMKPIGYILMQYSAKSSRPVKSYLRWADKIPEIYAKYVLGKKRIRSQQVEEEPNCLGLLKHYYSLAPMSMEAKKPIFQLKPADGAIGAHVEAVRKSHADFDKLASRIVEACS